MSEALLDLLDDPDALRRQNRCVVEGTEAVRQLLLAEHEVDLVVALPGRAADLRAAWDLRPRAGLLLDRPRPWISERLGRSFRRGALAVAQRPATTPWPTLLAAATAPCWGAIALDRIADPANVGSIIRSARCLGLDAVILGPGCADPFYRQALRSGMGHGFHMPIAEVTDLPACLADCQQAGIVAVAAALDGDPATTAIAPRWLLVVGNEDAGVDPAVRSVCPATLAIPMAIGCDSLSVAVAAALLADRLRR